MTDDGDYNEANLILFHALKGSSAAVEPAQGRKKGKGFKSGQARTEETLAGTWANYII